MKQLLSIIIAILLFSSCEVTSVYLVRHADRAGQEDRLSDKGNLRAIELERVLRHADIDLIFTTNYERTRNTINPLAEAHDIPISVYQYDEIEELAATVREVHSGQNILIVGHSNTIPQTVNALVPGAGLTDLPHTEFDKMYNVLITSQTEKYLTLEYGSHTQ